MVRAVDLVERVWSLCCCRGWWRSSSVSALNRPPFTLNRSVSNHAAEKHSRWSKHERAGTVWYVRRVREMLKARPGRRHCRISGTFCVLFWT